MKSLVKIMPYIIMAIAVAAVVPVLASRIYPGLRVGLFLPIILYAATVETLPVVLVLAWLLGLLNDMIGFLPTGVSIFSLQIVSILASTSSQWFTVRSALGFAVICLPAALLNEFLGFIVLSVIGQRPGLALSGVLVMALSTAIWGLFTFLILEEIWELIRKAMAKSGLEIGA